MKRSKSSRTKDSSSEDSESCVPIGGQSVERQRQAGADGAPENPDWIFLNDRTLATKRLAFNTKLQVG